MGTPYARPDGTEASPSTTSFLKGPLMLAAKRARGTTMSAGMSITIFGRSSASTSTEREMLSFLRSMSPATLSANPP